MKTGKNFLLLISLALSVLLLTACSGGSSSSSSSTTPAVTPEPVVTDPPATLTILAGDTKIRLNWDAVSSSTYKIYQSTQTFGTITELSQLAGKFLKTADTNSATIEGLINGTEYHFVVTAVKEGIESLPSNAVSAAPGAAIPSNLQVVDASENGAIKLIWTGILAATSYNIHQATTTFANKAAADYSSLAGYAVTTASAATHELKNLTHGTTYHFLITAVTSGTESTASNTVFAQPKLSAPTGVSQGTGTGYSTSFHWDEITDVSSVTYVIHRAEVPFTGAVEDYSTTTLAGHSSTTIKHPGSSYWEAGGLITGKTYYFVITAVKNGQHSPASKQETYYARPNKHDHTPVVTAGHQALYVKDFQRDLVAGDTRFHIASQSFAGITDFSSTNLSATLANYQYFDVVDAYKPADDYHTFSDLINGTQYYIVLTTFRNNTHSLPTTQVTATPALPAPTGFAAEANLAQVTLSWNAVTSASYKVYYGEQSFATLDTIKNYGTVGGIMVEVASTAVSTASHTITGLTNGTKYYFVITAVLDDVESVASAELTAIPRLSKMTGHTGSVQSVALSPDGNSIVSGGNDHSVRIWNSTSGVQTSTLTGHGSFVLSVAYNHDGTRIVSGGADNTVRLWNASSGTQITSLTEPSDWIYSVAFNSSGTQIASGSEDGTARIWNVSSTPMLAHSLTGHNAFAGFHSTYIAFSPDGTQLITGDYAGDVRLWNTASGIQNGSNIVTGVKKVQAITFSPNNKYFAVAYEANDIFVYNSTSHARISLSGHSEYVNAIAFSPDSSKIISGSRDDTIKIWDAVSGGAALETLTGHTDVVRSVSISKDGKRIVSGSDDETIRVWYPERLQD